MLRNNIMLTLDPSWNYAKQEGEIGGLSCGPIGFEHHSMLICTIEQGKTSSYPADRLIEKAGDALYLQWDQDPMRRVFNNWNINYAKMSLMASTLNGIDSVASLSGRATQTAMFAHYTGDPAYYSRSIERWSALDTVKIQEMAQKYITRDRMAAIIIEPIDQNERDRLEASSATADNDSVSQQDTISEHHTTEDDLARMLFDLDQLSPDIIKNNVAVPDLDKVKRFTLDNQLSVAIMNHGDAPLIRVGLRVNGGNLTAPKMGLDSLTHSLFVSAFDSDDDPLRVAGQVYRAQTQGIYASGSSMNLDALLHKMRAHIDQIDWQMANKPQRIKAWTNRTKAAGRQPETWSDRLRDERVFPDHARGHWYSPSDYEAMKELGVSELKDWFAEKWQPANAELVIVGSLDVEETEKLVRDFFDSWEYTGSGSPGKITPIEPPSKQPDRQILVFDKPISTQSRVSMICQVKRESDADNARTRVLGEILSNRVFQKLREEQALTYGAYAYPVMYEDMTTLLGMGTVIQNDGVGTAVETMLALVAEASEGKLADGLVATTKWNLARTSVLGLQSSEQMLNTLLGVGLDNLDYFSHYPDDLANVSSADFTDALDPCIDHEVFTIVGPADQVTSQLDAVGFEYEVIDWRGLYESQLSKKELKTYRKAQTKAEKKRADQETAANDGVTNDGVTNGTDCTPTGPCE